MLPEARVEDVVRQRLRSLRVARGGTLDDLAHRSNIGPSTISRIETGKRRLAIDNLADRRDPSDSRWAIGSSWSRPGRPSSSTP